MCVRSCSKNSAVGEGRPLFVGHRVREPVRLDLVEVAVEGHHLAIERIERPQPEVAVPASSPYVIDPSYTPSSSALIVEFWKTSCSAAASGGPGVPECRR